MSELPWTKASSGLLLPGSKHPTTNSHVPSVQERHPKSAKRAPPELNKNPKRFAEIVGLFCHSSLELVARNIFYKAVRADGSYAIYLVTEDGSVFSPHVRQARHLPDTVMHQLTAEELGLDSKELEAQVAELEKKDG